MTSYRKPVYLFHRRGRIITTVNPKTASKMILDECYTDRTSWYIEYGKDPVPLDVRMLLKRLVEVPEKEEKAEDCYPTRKPGRQPRFAEEDVTEVYTAIRNFGLNKASRVLEVSKSVLNNYRYRMRKKGLWPED